MPDNKMSIKTLFSSKQAILESKLSILLDHPVTKGDHCEAAWIDFLETFYQASMPWTKALCLMQLDILVSR